MLIPLIVVGLLVHLLIELTEWLLSFRHCSMPPVPPPAPSPAVVLPPAQGFPPMPKVNSMEDTVI